MGVLGARMRESFESDMVARLRDTYPAQASRHTDAALLAFVRAGIQRAETYRVDTVSDVERWIDLMVRMGPQFDSDPRWPEVLETLRQQEVDAQIRLDMIEARLGRE
jgi:hypothetical protein